MLRDTVKDVSHVREFTDDPDIPFIFMSGYDDESTRNLVVDPEHDFFFSKTTPIDKVLTLIDSLRGTIEPEAQ